MELPAIDPVKLFEHASEVESLRRAAEVAKTNFEKRSREELIQPLYAAFEALLKAKKITVKADYGTSAEVQLRWDIRSYGEGLDKESLCLFHRSTSGYGNPINVGFVADTSDDGSPVLLFYAWDYGTNREYRNKSVPPFHGWIEAYQFAIKELASKMIIS
jgi:hypothetical protein